MIKTLNIKNFALIEELSICFNKGLNVLIGETGAGKSIIIDAIDAAFGARIPKDIIRTGQTKAYIEIELQLAVVSKSLKNKLVENAVELTEDNSLVISREITLNSTKSRLNGVLVTQNFIQELRECLIDIHSQHETYNYLKSSYHITLLDSYGDEKHRGLLESFEVTFQKYNQTKKELDFLSENINSQRQRADFLKFQIEEISSAKITEEKEYEDLIAAREVLINAESLKEVAYNSYSSIYEVDSSIVDALSKIESKLKKASDMDKALVELVDIISSSTISLKEAANELRSYSENLDIDGNKLSEIEERIELLDKLKKKYGPTIENVLNSLSEFENELGKIETSDERIEKLQQDLKILSNKVDDLAKSLSLSRIELSELLSSKIQKELVNLEMPNAIFNVAITKKSSLTSNGGDDVEFMISPNPGEPLKSLAKIASGGEISRVMLAAKSVFAESDSVNTVIFDEIDSGISGKTSQSVAEKLTELSFSQQILCITHQPIIAAMADCHFYIEKIQNDDNTYVKVKELNKNEQISALSKLASGSEETESINFAQSLLEQAKTFKDNYNASVKV